MPTAFSWRKKWERCWDEVKYCSERCRKNQGFMNWNETIAACRDTQPAEEVALICGDQLNEHHSWIDRPRQRGCS